MRRWLGPLAALLLVAAAFAVREAYLDRLTSGPGLLAGAVTLALVLAVSRSREASHRLWIEEGVLHVDDGVTRQRVDLTSSDTIVEMLGRPGARRWRVLVIRRGGPPLTVDRTMVDPVRFVEALRAYRPRP